MNHKHIEVIMEDHDYAKALWGEDWLYYYEGKWNDTDESEIYRSRSPFVLMRYQYHLQHMIIADDPIKYLGENI